MQHNDGRAQSAMEYLTTYGWAVGGVSVVLYALFALGIFNSSAAAVGSCVAYQGFLCTGAQYSHKTANIIVTLGQETGTNWATANFVFVPVGTPISQQGVPIISFHNGPANTVLTKNGEGFMNNREMEFYLPVNGIGKHPINIGTPVTGSIWVYYTVPSANGKAVSGYVRIATINVKAS